MAAGKPPFLVLAPALQTYAWGKKGSRSEACSLSACADSEFVPDENQTYAELWMGTHKKGPAIIKHPGPLAGTLLSDWLKDNQWALGQAVATEFGGELPFLFKILSVNQALSIQAHPDKKRAAELHAQAPDKYPDPNHKPEMVLALGEFEGMCGFRPFSEIRSWVVAIPELQEVLGEKVTGAIRGLGEDVPAADQLPVMRLAFSSLMSADPAAVKEQLQVLVKRLGSLSTDALSREEVLVCQLNQLYPGDVGCFCVFFLNVARLSSGGSLFLPANEPHCYLSGDVVECMACSDNVVRAGLTQKFKDKATLCDMLTYHSKTLDHFQVCPQRDKRSRFSEIYDPPIPEFAVERVSVPVGVGEFCLPALSGPSILLVVKGKADMTVGGHGYSVKRGIVLFISAEAEPKFLSLDTAQEILMFRAFCELLS